MKPTTGITLPASFVVAVSHAGTEVLQAVPRPPTIGESRRCRLQTANNTTGLYPMVGMPHVEEPGATTSLGSYPFPVVQADNFLDVDKVIRPLCDQVHQMFGKDSSRCFNAEGVWNR
jgi:hypothetical protein